MVGDATQLLTAAGFTVQPLPLDRDPRQLRGLIFLGSFVSETAEYKDWVARFPTEIYTFVDAANVLVEMSQADQTEERPPFLPTSQSARRTDVDVGALVYVHGFLSRRRAPIGGAPELLPAWCDAGHT